MTLSAFAQIPEDVLKYSWVPVNGTARVNAIGGAMGSLGGDISATFVNPAGLAFYKTSDIVLSPGYSFLKNKSNFRGTNASDNNGLFNLGPTGYVSGFSGQGRWSKAFSIAVNRTANFSNKIYFTGQNDFSSAGEQYAAEIAGSGVFIEDVPGSNQVSYGSRLAAYNFYVDTASIPGHAGQDVISRAMFDALKNNGDFLVNQTQTTETSGGITEIALGYAGNLDDKLYIGGSLGLPIVKYEKKTTFREEDATGNADNDFNFNELSETFTTKGMGINAKLGIIVKPVEYLRVGLAVHTPTWYSFEDSYHGVMTTDLDKFRSTAGPISIASNQLPGETGDDPVYKYELFSPWRFMLSGAYVLNEIEDVRKQKGFITADVEYVTYKSNKFRDSEDYGGGGGNDTYYDAVNEVMKEYYKNAINFRVGGELKFTTLMTRLGFSYYGNPYADKSLKANKMYVSGGVGYRNTGMYIDLTYVQALQKDVNFPYRLPDKANTFATTKGSGGSIMLTVGFKI